MRISNLFPAHQNTVFATNWLIKDLILQNKAAPQRNTQCNPTRDTDCTLLQHPTTVVIAFTLQLAASADTLMSTVGCCLLPVKEQSAVGNKILHHMHCCAAGVPCCKAMAAHHSVVLDKVSEAHKVAGNLAVLGCLAFAAASLLLFFKPL